MAAVDGAANLFLLSSLPNFSPILVPSAQTPSLRFDGRANPEVLSATSTYCLATGQ